MNEASRIAATWWGTKANGCTEAAIVALILATEQACNVALVGAGECLLEVDWYPSGTLLDVCKAIHDHHGKVTFPQKTRMVVKGDSVVVKKDGLYVRLFGEVVWQVVHYDALANRTILYTGDSEDDARNLFQATQRECRGQKDVDVYLMQDGNVVEGDE